MLEIHFADTRCGEPPSIPNGEAQSDASRKYAPGERMAYICHEGFEVDRPRGAICKDAEWSQLPSCKGKKLCFH